jgi:hypothetical protein
MPTMTEHQGIIDIAEAALCWTADQALLSQGHCVNMFLDLYSATEDFSIRWAIAERLNEIRFLNAVEGSDMIADLTAIIEIASADIPSRHVWSAAA